MTPYPRRLLALVLALGGLPLPALAASIASGPLVGAPEMRAMPLWIQLDAPAEVRFAYWPEGQPGQRQLTPTASAQQEDAYAVTLTAGPLDPGTAYRYAVLVDGAEVPLEHEARFQTTPFFTDRAPPPDFSVALGSGHRVNDDRYDPLNRAPGDGYEIFLAILAKQPDFMLWLGDSVTLREPDQGSRAGMLARYSRNRAQPELQPLIQAVPQVAVFGEGETAPGADRHFRNLEDAREVFGLFWPGPPAAPSVGGTASILRYGDAEFFLLDTRSFRDLEHDRADRREILGPEQMQWLRQRLRRSDATFKIIALAGPVLNPADSPRHLVAAKDERDTLLDQLKHDEIEGLLFVSGGKDFGEMTKMVRANAPDAYELTVGPLTDRPAERTRELNYYRVPNTSAFQRHFALLRFHGPEDNRQVTLSAYDVHGDELWSQTFAARDMRFE